jgi:hypothetical protein
MGNGSPWFPEDTDSEGLGMLGWHDFLQVLQVLWDLFTHKGALASPQPWVPPPGAFCPPNHLPWKT